MKNYREVADAVLERRDAYRKAQKKRRDTIIRTAAGSGVLCLMALLGLWIYRGNLTGPDSAGLSPDNPADAYYVLSESDAPESHSTESLADAGSITGDDGGMTASADTNGTAASEESIHGNASDPATDQESASSGGSFLPVSYSSLQFPQGQIVPDVISHYGSGGQSSAEILPFDEDMLSHCCAILEGTVTDMYLKTYSYDTYGDKFGEKEIYHNQASSVVYELTVGKVWYGDESLSGSSVLIEDETYLVDSCFSLKVGCDYVIPLSDTGQEKWIREEYAGGDLTRDSRYTTLYPHHPQIEVTADGKYLVSTDWQTLCSADDANVYMDVPADLGVYGDTLVEYHPENRAGEDGLITTEWRTLLISAYDANYYYDRMKLIEGDKFFIRLNQLTDRLP